MTKREIVKLVLDGKKPPYVPWSFSFTVEAKEKLIGYYHSEDIISAAGNHILGLGSDIGFFEDIGDNRVRDVFGVIWDRSIDKDIGNVEGCVLKNPSLAGYEFPDPLDPRFYDSISRLIGRYGDRFRVYQIGFSLFERAWTMRGMTNLMMDFYDHPRFVRDLFNAIADYNTTQIEKALEYDIDAVYFGDDWGQQRGLLMGPAIWREFIQPVLKRMYGIVRDAGKYVCIHSCGDVDELFDDLADIGLNLFNPFQPEVMDIEALITRYRGKLAFFGGLSTQRTLPFGSRDEVRQEVRRLIALGRDGGYILSPAHAVEGDVPLENMLVMIDEVKKQPGYMK